MKRNKIFRILFFAALFAIVALLIYFAFIAIMPELIPLLKDGDEAAIEDYLRHNSNFTGILCTALLQMVQIVSVVLSGVPIQIAAGIVYGTWRGFAICHLSTVAASTGVFAVIRKTGEKLDKFFPTNDGKLSKLDFIRNSDRPAYTITIAYLIPLIPNGFIPYFSAKSRITVKEFAIAVFVGSFIPILLMNTIGNKILTGGYVGAAVMCGVLFVVIFLLYKFKKPILDFIDKHFSFVNSGK